MDDACTAAMALVALELNENCQWRQGDEREPCSESDVTMVASEMYQQPNDICMHLL
jgi:hypothetical protein